MYYTKALSFSDSLTHLQITKFDSSKLKEFADDNIYFHVNDGKFSIGVENTVGKGEIARYCRHIKSIACLGRIKNGEHVV